MELGMFVIEPETIHFIYHLSLDDMDTLCYRDAREMICIGVTDEHRLGLITELHAGTGDMLMRRCCLNCHKALVRVGRASGQ